MGVLTRIKKNKNKNKKQEKRHHDQHRSSAFLKVVHPHGYAEIFYQPITAGEIMRRYPRHCVARTDFFEYPWIVVRPESLLVPGKMFFLVSYKTVERTLKEKRQQMDQSMHVRPNHDHHHHQHVRPNTNHHRHHHHHDEEGNGSHDDQEQQDSDNAGSSKYKSSFYESWKEMQGRLFDPNFELDSPLQGGRPHVESPDLLEFQRLKSCISHPESDRRKLDLKVRFASTVEILSSGSACLWIRV